MASHGHESYPVNLLSAEMRAGLGACLEVTGSRGPADIPVTRWLRRLHCSPQLLAGSKRLCASSAYQRVNTGTALLLQGEPVTSYQPMQCSAGLARALSRHRTPANNQALMEACLHHAAEMSKRAPQIANGPQLESHSRCNQRHHSNKVHRDTSQWHLHKAMMHMLTGQE